jgi:hypothetical protein|tara:strand:- start:39 stop:503 length:465 start_codon:yes stop_codon:yes gene_type:complete
MQDRSWNRDDDYATLVKWWKQWEFGVVPKECLPPDGIIVEDNGTPICAGGLYIGEGTQFAFMEWIVTDKNADARRTHTALKMCIDRIMDLAKSKGIKLVYTATKEQALHKRYTKYHDMVLTETNVKTFIRDLDGSYSEDLAWISDDEQIESRNK